MNTIKFKACRDVKCPERDGKNAGYDLFVPKFTAQFIDDLYNMNVAQFESQFIPYAYNHFATSREQYDKLIKTGALTIKPINGHFNIKIPSGIKYKMEDTNDDTYTYMFKITNKSGVASKNSVITGACACDMEYRDEVVVNLIGFKPLVLRPDVKMVQGIIHRVETPKVEFIPYNDDSDIFGSSCSNRGGGFNSTGNGL